MTEFKQNILDFISKHEDKRLCDFLPNVYNIDYFNDEDLKKISEFCEDYSQVEGKKLKRVDENNLKKELMIKYLKYLKQLDIMKNSFYFTLSIRADDALTNINSFYSDLYIKNYFDDSVY